MAICGLRREPLVKLASSNGLRVQTSPARAGMAVQGTGMAVQGAGQIATPIGASMASSSSSSSSIHIKSGPIEGDVLWLQPKHVSEHVWNGEADRKLHIRRVVPIYQGQEEIPEEIIPLLRQSGFYWIMKMGYLKINSSLIIALIEIWRPETHTFHLRCEEDMITLQDVSVLLGLHTEGAPLIGQTNLDWAELCEELLGVRPQEGELQGSVVKLSWLAHHFSEINIHDGNVEQLQRFTRAWILRFIGGVLFVDKSSSKVSLRWLRRGNQHIGNDDVIVFRRKLNIMKRHEFLWEPYTTTVMSMLPPICLVGSMSWCAVVPLICFHVVEWHQSDRVLRQFGMQQPIPESPSQPWNVHGLTLKGKWMKIGSSCWPHLSVNGIIELSLGSTFMLDKRAY
ncbi:Serine/threonine-protein phosphatase 7 long form [Glycine soja]